MTNTFKSFLLVTTIGVTMAHSAAARAASGPQTHSPETRPSDAVPPAAPATPAQGATQTTLIGEAESERSDIARPSTEARAQDEIQVTGSRLAEGDVTARKIVIDRAQIKARGVTSVEDLLRTIPQNLATIGAITNERGNGPLLSRTRGPGAGVSQLGSLGVSAANLGGIGAGNTLVLVNGRRMAGAAGIEDGFVNLNGIPLSAIERVEIIPSGSAAIYGADALGGVINFILRKDARGLTLGSQSEYSNNGANSARFNGYGSYGWGSGSMSATADYQVRRPINNRKTGYVTSDYSAIFNDPAYDFRSFSNGLQPGVIDRSGFEYDPATDTVRNVRQGLTVRPGLNRAPTIDDFITVGPEALGDFIPRLAGPDSRTLGFTANLDQQLTDKLSFFASGLWTRSKNVQEVELGQGLSLSLAPGQAYNPFPAGNFDGFTPETRVAYVPAAEAAAGVIVPGQLRNTATQWNVTAGLAYAFNDHTRLNLIYNTSRSTSRGTGTRLQSVADFETAPDGSRRCYNFLLAENRITGAARDNLQSAFDRQCRALTSADPGVAFNPFNSTAAGSGGSIRDFLYTDAVEDRGSRLEQYEARLTGRLMTLPAGGLTYAVGGEYASDGADSTEINAVTGAAGSRSRYAGFAEIGLPILGNGYDLPLIRSLTFNLAGRVDGFKTTGPVGTVNSVPVSQGGQLIYGTNRFSRLTPSFGLRYQPIEQITVLAKWGRGFQPPPFTQLFSAGGTQQFSTAIIGDPFYACTTDCILGNPQRGYLVPFIIAPNADLRPQTSRQESFTASWRPTGFLTNLQLDATYNRTVIRNEFSRLDDLRRLTTSAQLFSLAKFYPRDANGKITRVQNSVFNIIGSEYRSMTYEASYFLTTGIGNFEPRVVLVDNLRAFRQGTRTSTRVSRLGTIQGPDDYRMTASLSYFRDHVSLIVFANHVPSYINDYDVDFLNGVQQVSPSLRKVDSYTTFDLTGAWNPAGKLRLNFAIRNIFDPKPPFAITQGRPYDTARWNAAGRTAMVQVEYNF